MNIVPMLDFVNKINSQEIFAECEIAFQKLAGLPIADKVDLMLIRFEHAASRG